MYGEIGVIGRLAPMKFLPIEPLHPLFEASEQVLSAAHKVIPVVEKLKEAPGAIDDTTVSHDEHIV